MKVGERWRRRTSRANYDDVTGYVQWPNICVIKLIQESRLSHIKGDLVTYYYPDWPHRASDVMTRANFIKEFEKVY